MNRFELERSDRVHRPLVSRAGLGALGTCVIGVLCLLLPTAMQRQHLALEILPDALSLVYLDLNLAHRPDDVELRYRVAHKTLQAGQLEAARTTLGPLLVPGSPLFRRAEELRLEIDQKAWAAIDPSFVQARASALARVIADIDAMDLSNAAPERVQRLATLYESLAEPARAAVLLDRLARRFLPDYAAHARAAQAAHLRADQAARAVELQVFLAETLGGDAGVRHALEALELAPATLNPRAQLELAERLRTKLGADNLQLVAASLTLAEAIDVKLAFELARRMARARPTDLELRRRVARLAQWNGLGLRALDEYVWLTRNGGTADDRARAIELARANWDLPLLRQLLQGASAAEPRPVGERRVTRRAPAKRRASQPLAAARDARSAQRACGPRARPLPRDATAPVERAPSTRRLDRSRAALGELVSLYEALGDSQAALAAVGAALRGELASDVATWQLQIQLFQRVGQPAAAAGALSTLALRFPSQARSRELAQLWLSLGRPRDALAALRRGPKPWTEDYLRQLLELAWEQGELALAKQLAGRIAKLPAASAWDVTRLWQMQRMDPDPQVPLATALAGFARFRNAEMLRLAIDSAQRLNDDTRVAHMLQQAERFDGFRADPGYWQHRITLHHKLAFAAVARQEFTAAKRELGKAQKALERAPDLAPSQTKLYQELWTSQYAQVLSVALEAGDRTALARVFDRYDGQLSVRQRVHVLHRLDRHAEALALARIGAADPRLSDSDRAALRAEGLADSAATAGSPDYVRAHSELLHTEGLRIWTHEAELAIDSQALGLGFSTTWSDLTPQLGLRALQPEAARELSAELTGRVWGTELTAGARLRDEAAPRPYGAWRQRIVGDHDTGLAASFALNSLSFESSQLRLLGATDEVALQSSIAFGRGYYLSARAAGNRYLTLDRDYLGAGLSVDSGVGRSIALPSDLGRVAMRLTGRFAPRLRDPGLAARADERRPANWVPETSAFAGVGASLARGELTIPRASDPSFRFLLDGSIGVLWPNQRLGWTGQVGLGSALFGRDQLSAELQAGNVIGSEMFWVVQAGYAVGL